MFIKQTPNLTYRAIDGCYYVVNPLRREVVVLNESAFRILELAHDCTLDKLCAVLSQTIHNSTFLISSNDTFDREEIIMCLQSLKEASLIEL